MALRLRISRIVGYPESALEPLQGVRYEPGQFYKPHHDYYNACETWLDGNRHFTFLVRPRHPSPPTTTTHTQPSTRTPSLRRQLSLHPPFPSSTWSVRLRPPALFTLPHSLPPFPTPPLRPPALLPIPFHPRVRVYGSRRIIALQVYTRVSIMQVYLNHVDAGGQTGLPRLNLSVETTPYAALLFNNCLDNGEPDERTQHEGVPPTSGPKYAINGWMRSKHMGRYASRGVA